MAKVIQDVPYGINSTKLDRGPHETFASFKAKRTNGISYVSVPDCWEEIMQNLMWSSAQTRVTKSCQ